jgi:hypothetical protein
MTIATDKTLIHWNYFLALETDLIQLSRYIEFNPRNFECYSLENARILMAATQEVDVVCKLICKAMDPASTADNIHRYREKILSLYPKFSHFPVEMKQYGLKLSPWDNFNNQSGVPDWWIANNKVKHERHSDFHQANLKNVLNAVAGLYVCCLYFYKDVIESGDIRPMPKVFWPVHYKKGSRFIQYDGAQPELD